MPPAVAVPAVIGGIGLMDQMFGSGKKSRDMQQEGLGIQRDLANAQLPDIQRRTALNAELEELLKGVLKQPTLPKQFLDLDPVMQQFIPGMDLLDESLFRSVGPGVMRKGAFDQLAGLGGNVGTGGIQGFANLSTGLGESRRSEFSDTIGQLVQALLMGGALGKPTPKPVSGAQGLPWTAGPGGAFNIPLG